MRDFPEMKMLALEPLNRGKTSNVQHRTPNAEVREGFALPFGVRRWMFLWVHGETGRGVPIWFMVPIRFQILEVPPLHEPYPRSGVSAERRWLLFPRIAALCRDAATPDRKSTRLNSSHSQISYAVFCLKKNTLELVTS